MNDDEAESAGDGRGDRTLGARMFGERVLDAVPESVFVFDPTGRLVWWNRHATTTTGYDDAQLASLDPGELVDPGERDRFESWVAGLFEADEESGPVETVLVDAAGRAVPYEFVGAVLDDDSHEAAGAVTTGRDISERRARQELERQNERLEEFASVVSHDLRNPLTVAEGHLSLARVDVDNEDLGRVAEAHGRMYDLIDDLLTLARAGNTVGETEPVELETVARQAWAGVETGRSELRVTGDRTLEADPRRLRELFENLFRNAMEHGTPSRAAGDGDDGEDAGVTIGVGPLESGGFFIEDDGPGIPEVVREGVFDSGYTTTDQGTGFGLAIVEDIAEAHGWTVSAHESSTGGARFELRVPETN